MAGPHLRAFRPLGISLYTKLYNAKIVCKGHTIIKINSSGRDKRWHLELLRFLFKNPRNVQAPPSYEVKKAKKEFSERIIF